MKEVKKDNELQDIVLERESIGSERLKKVLLTVAALFLIFLIVIVIYKLISGGSEESKSLTPNPVAQKEQESLKESITELKEDIFKQEKIIDDTTETDLKFEEMVRKLKEQDITEESQKEKPAPKPKEVIKEPSKKEIKITHSEQPVKPKPVEIIKTKVEKPKEAYKLSTISGFFVQVGATYGTYPDKAFLKKINKNGFDYIVHKTYVKGKAIKKVLVGPYDSKEKARQALLKIRNTIKPDAFIYRLN